MIAIARDLSSLEFLFEKYGEITKESEHFEDNKNAYSVRSGVRKTAYTAEKLRKIRAILRYREHC